MPGSLSVTKFRNVTIKSVAPSITTTSVSGVRQSKQIAGQYWQMDIDFTSLDRSEFANVMGFISKQRNGLYSFSVTIPDISEPAGDIHKVLEAGGSSAMDVTSNVATGSSAVAFDTGFTSTDFTNAGADLNVGFRAGDFVKFSNHNKVYQITDDVVWNATGGGTMNIFPNLVDAVTTSDTIVYDDVPFLMFSTADTQEYQYSIGGDNQVSITLQEAVGE